jgi:hypothetical protein
MQDVVTTLVLTDYIMPRWRECSHRAAGGRRELQGADDTTAYGSTR